MPFANPQTDWSLLSGLLRFAQREGWTVAFQGDRVRLTHWRAAQGVLVLPASVLAHARGAGWRVSRRGSGFELRHSDVRRRIEVVLAV